MDENPAEDEDSPTMTAEIHGVLRLHPWIGRVSADYDLDEDLFSLAVKRAATYGWSSALLGVGQELSGQRWGHADAGGDWSQDGRVRQLAWLTVYPTVGLRAQHLPVRPMTQVLTDALHRMGVLHFTGLRVQAPVRLAPDASFDLRADADWFSLASPDAKANVTVAISTGSNVTETLVRDLVAQRGHGLLHIEQTHRHSPDSGGVAPSASPLGLDDVPRAPDMVFTVSAPEWTPDAAAWIAEVVVDSLRAAGVRAPTGITVHQDGGDEAA
ncbi:hypothetical protein [Streptomyces hebeiensis]